MNRKLILLTLALLGLATALSAQLRRHYLDSKAHEIAVLRKTPQPRPVLAPPPVPAPQPVAPVQYINVAQQTLFSKDRNPNVVVEAPPPKPEPPMPALPVYYGQMSFGDPAILLSVNGGAQQRFHKGEKAGAFEIVGFDNEKITLRWNDKTIERKLSELKPKEAEQPAPMRGAYQATAPAPLAGGPVVKSVGGGPAASDPDKNKPDPVMGIDRGDGFYGCQMNDPTPSGTVVAGYRKVVSQTLMGKACYWEKVK